MKRVIPKPVKFIAIPRDSAMEIGRQSGGVGKAVAGEIWGGDLIGVPDVNGDATRVLGGANPIGDNLGYGCGVAGESKEGDDTGLANGGAPTGIEGGLGRSEGAKEVMGGADSAGGASCAMGDACEGSHGAGDARDGNHGVSDSLRRLGSVRSGLGGTTSTLGCEGNALDDSSGGL